MLLSQRSSEQWRHLKWWGSLSGGARSHEEVGTSSMYRCGSQGPASVRFVVEPNDLKGQPKQSSDSMTQRQLLELVLEWIDFFISSSQLVDLIHFFQFSLLLEEGYNLRNMNYSHLKINKKTKKIKIFQEKEKPNQTNKPLHLSVFSYKEIFCTAHNLSDHSEIWQSGKNLASSEPSFHRSS